MESIDLMTKFRAVTEHWRPKLIAELNGQEVRLVKFQGVFPWHHHADADELFLARKGAMKIEFRDGVVALQTGNCMLFRAASSIAPRRTTKWRSCSLSPPKRGTPATWKMPGSPPRPA